MAMTTRKKLLLLGLLLLASLVGVGIAHSLSPSRDLEEALALRRLPPSIAHIHLHAQSWTDYAVIAYFEISPEDFETLITARPYSHWEFSSEDNYRPMGSDTFRGVSPFIAAHSYEWNDQRANCRLWTDGTKRKVFLIYGD